MEEKDEYGREWRDEGMEEKDEYGREWRDEG